MRKLIDTGSNHDEDKGGVVLYLKKENGCFWYDASWRGLSVQGPASSFDSGIYSWRYPSPEEEAMLKQAAVNALNKYLEKFIPDIFAFLYPDLDAWIQVGIESGELERFSNED